MRSDYIPCAAHNHFVPDESEIMSADTTFIPLYRFWQPRFWPGWLVLAILRLLVMLPHSIRMACGRFLGRLAEPLVERLDPGASGLDFGCGPGPALAAMLTRRGYTVARAIHDQTGRGARREEAEVVHIGRGRDRQYGGNEGSRMRCQVFIILIEAEAALYSI